MTKTTLLNTFPIPTYFQGYNLSLTEFLICIGIIFLLLLVLFYIVRNRIQKKEARLTQVDSEIAFYQSKDVLGLKKSLSASRQLPFSTRFSKVQIALAIILIVLMFFWNASDFLGFGWYY